MRYIEKPKEYLGSHKERGSWVAWQRLDWDWWIVTKNGFNRSSRNSPPTKTFMKMIKKILNFLIGWMSEGELTNAQKEQLRRQLEWGNQSKHN